MTGHTVGLRPDVTINRSEDRVVIAHPWGSVSVQGPDWLEGVLTALQHEELDADGVVDALVNAGVDSEIDVVTAIGDLTGFLASIPMVVQRSYFIGEFLSVRLVPVGVRAPHVVASALADDCVLSLSPYAYMHRQSGESGITLESPLALHRAFIGSPIVGCVARIAAEPTRADDISNDLFRASVGLLVAGGLLETNAGESRDVADHSWSFHDLLFHAKSRQGRTDDLFGAHLLHADESPPPSPVAPRRTGEVTALAVPRFDDVVAADLPLTVAVESRQSLRDYASAPVTVDELGHLLYRCARLRGTVELEGVGGMLGADRPYPTGGMAGDLEIYVTVAACDGLEPAAYFYDSRAHELVRVNSLDTATPLLQAARLSAGGQVTPQILLTITSRFARTSWKYESIAYTLTLKHVGVLMQTIYLVATSMGLAPCALGSGNSDDAAEIFGLDWTTESSVGEMLIGRPAVAPQRSNTFVDDRPEHSPHH